MITVLNGGCATKHPSSFRMVRPEGLPNYVILIVRTAGAFCINNQHYCVTPGHAIILTPHTPYSYNNPDGIYMDDWLHFQAEDSLLYQYPTLPMNRPFPITNMDIFTLLIKQILWEKSYETSELGKENIHALTHVLFNHLISSYRSREHKKLGNLFHEQLQALRLDMQNDFSELPTIEKYAKRLGISSSYFQHIYRDFFGISFQQDLIQLRIEHAKYILTTTDLTQEQIAELCGYTNEVHFYRQFKKMTGYTPAKYRKSQITLY
ncbi:AraC family transcriptional regulator [Anaerosporobacter faecicola]|uniref:AraC family transcriptional regulator n=1 Tax=Anaerosporobacter faecicola TaxID=2718714 RepID=UPI00143C2AB7|nr:AraC family transcriptional regulator [Anaerosporobacter faecicola]